jgi:tRNA threonylcarbamoyladenosine biosynthesis protein TsaB
LLLAIETSTERGGVALLPGQGPARELRLEPESRHASTLLLAIDRLLRDSAVRMEQVHSIALSVGPGSFTGLRIGLSTALGLCFGTARRMVAVPTLAALSLQGGDAPRIAALLDARKGQVYAGLYGPAASELLPDCVTDPLPWLAALRGLGEIAFLGPGAQLYRNEIRTQLGDTARLVEAERGWPRARSVGMLALRLLERGLAQTPERVTLRYLRASEAEERRALHPGREPIP